MKLHSASAKSSLPHAQLDWEISRSIIVLNQTKVQSLVRASPFTHTSSDQLYAILLFCISAVGPHALQGSTLSLYTVASQVWCSEAKLLGHAGSSLVASATNGRTPVFLGVGTYDDRMAHSRSTTFWCLWQQTATQHRSDLLSPVVHNRNYQHTPTHWLDWLALVQQVATDDDKPQTFLLDQPLLATTIHFQLKIAVGKQVMLICASLLA